MAIIEVENVSKRFRAARGVRALLGRGGLPDLVRGRRAAEIAALDGITFSVEPGESLGLIGANGSGKSTLLKLVAGVTTPTEGSIRVYGRVASLLELGAGFHPLLSGRENIYLNAGIHGMRHAQVDAIFDHIVEFSGIAKFIDAPVSTYSSGMYVRLGFAVAAHLNPDIFLIDEVLAVGDEEFQRKCRAKIGELMESGKTILFVSHDLSIVNILCRRVLLLQNGKMIARGTPAKAIDFYLRQVGAPKGVHTLRSGETEVVFSNGRLSIFLRQEELTTPHGLRSQVFRLGGWRASTDAKWAVTEATDTRCVARGHDARLGATLVWDITLDGTMLDWSTHWEFEGPTELDFMENTLFFPLDYATWVFDDLSGGFQEIATDDTTWAQMTAPSALSGVAAALPSADSPRPAIAITFADANMRTRASWSNSDYLTKSRVFRVEEVFQKGQTLPAGPHAGVSIRIDVAASRAEIDSRRLAEATRQTISSGRLSVRFDRGHLCLSVGERDISAHMHGYGSLLIQDLWNDSTSLRWERVERVQDRIRVTGNSRRFPFRLTWTLEAAGSGSVNWLVELDALEDLSVQEYQTSVMLIEDYTRWASAVESGEFPEILPGQTDWLHLNRNYTIGNAIRADGPGLPTVELRSDAPDIPIRMTPINPAYVQRARVLQALRAPDHGTLAFPRGKHTLFSGRIIVTGD